MNAALVAINFGLPLTGRVQTLSVLVMERKRKENNHCLKNV